jgi:hypothetical protein
MNGLTADLPRLPFLTQLEHRVADDSSARTHGLHALFDVAVQQVVMIQLLRLDYLNYDIAKRPVNALVCRSPR